MGFFHKGQTTIEYRNHTITCQISLSADLARFVPSAAIAWRNNGRLLVHFLRSDKECASGEDANAAALEEAKRWIDGNLTEDGFHTDEKRLGRAKTLKPR